MCDGGSSDIGAGGRGTCHLIYRPFHRRGNRRRDGHHRTRGTADDCHGRLLLLLLHPRDRCLGNLPRPEHQPQRRRLGCELGAPGSCCRSHRRTWQYSGPPGGRCVWRAGRRAADGGLIFTMTVASLRHSHSGRSSRTIGRHRAHTQCALLARHLLLRSVICARQHGRRRAASPGCQVSCIGAHMDPASRCVACSRRVVRPVLCRHRQPMRLCALSRQLRHGSASAACGAIRLRRCRLRPQWRLRLRALSCSGLIPG